MAKRLFFLISSLAIFPFVSLMFPTSTWAQSYYEEDLSCNFGLATAVPARAVAEFANNRSNFDQLESWQLDYANSSAPPYTAVSYPSSIGSGSEAVYDCQFSPSAYGIYDSGQLEFDYFNNNTGDSLTVYINLSGAYGVEGFINPKYVVLGVEYAPPGSQSNVTYGSNAVVGFSTATTDTFSTNTKESISMSTPGVPIPGFNSTRTVTVSNSYTQGQDTTDTIAVSQTSSNATGLTGYSDPTNGVNHDYDQILVWLNPINDYSVVPNSSIIQWNGWGYDLNDHNPGGPYMEVERIQLGCLNGDFYTIYTSDPNDPADQEWLTCVDVFNSNFSRTWALTNADGSGPALTPTLANSAPPYNFCQMSGTDLYNVCRADPFGNPSYVFTPPSPGSDTTADGRFTDCHASGCATTISYYPGSFYNHSQGYSTTVSSSQNTMYEYSQTFAVENQFKGTDFLMGFGADLSVSNTVTYQHKFNQTSNLSQGETASFTVDGPPAGYTGPTSFAVYQDNIYGTFIFVH